MTLFDFDAFGKPLSARNKTNGKAPAHVLQSNGAYDPALAPCYAPVGGHSTRESCGFTVPDNHAVDAAALANLQRYLYAGEAPIDAIDAV